MGHFGISPDTLQNNFSIYFNDDNDTSGDDDGSNDAGSMFMVP